MPHDLEVFLKLRVRRVELLPLSLLGILVL
jgi:hypothetical protein